MSGGEILGGNGAQKRAFALPESSARGSSEGHRFAPIWMVLGTLGAFGAIIALTRPTATGLFVYAGIFVPVLVAELILAPAFLRAPAREIEVSGAGVSVNYPGGAHLILRWAQLRQPISIVDRRNLPSHRGTRALVMVVPVRWLRPSVILSAEAFIAIIDSARAAGVSVSRHDHQMRVASDTGYLSEYVIGAR